MQSKNWTAIKPPRKEGVAGLGGEAGPIGRSPFAPFRSAPALSSRLIRKMSFRKWRRRIN